jgi:hypothetical protein
MIGVIFTFLVDMSTEFARKKGIKIPPDGEWNMETRLTAIILWPIGLVFFIRGFISTYYNNKKK